MSLLVVFNLVRVPCLTVLVVAHNVINAPHALFFGLMGISRTAGFTFCFRRHNIVVRLKIELKSKSKGKNLCENLNLNRSMRKKRKKMKIQQKKKGNENPKGGVFFKREKKKTFFSVSMLIRTRGHG